MRFIGLDIGRDFAHVAVVEGSGTARRLPRLAMGDEFRSFAATLGPDDTVALEASTNTWALADLLGAHAGRVVVSNPLRTKAIASAKRKTDDIDAATLAELLAADYLPPVWQPDEATRRLRRLTSHRAGLVHDRTAVRNRVAAVLSRHLVRAPMADVFGMRGRAWLAALELLPDERLTVDAALALDAVLCAQVEAAERAIATAVVDDPRVRRLLTIPGIGLVTAGSILAVVGDIDRFERPAKLVSYLGLDPGSASRATAPRCAATSAGRARPTPGGCCARPPTPRSARRDRWRGSMPGSRRDGVAASRSSRPRASSRCSCGTCSARTRTAGSRPVERTAFKQRQLDRLAGRSGTRPSQRGATGSSHDRGRARLRGGDDPHRPRPSPGD